MNKLIVVMIAIIVVIGAMFTAMMIFEPNSNEKIEKMEMQVAEEQIFDECTEEYEEIEKEDIIKANTQEEKTSPNCALITKTYFLGCKHIKTEYDNLPQGLVNLTKEEVQEKYSEYQIQNFASNELVRYQEKEGICGEHYLVKDKEGQVTIYQILEDGTQKEIEVTSVTTEYLPQTDKINMTNGIRVYGKQELNQLIEDFE